MNAFGNLTPFIAGTGWGTLPDAHGRLALPSLTFLVLDSLPAAQAGLAGGLFNVGRQTGGAPAVAVFGALISGSFAVGMRQALLTAAMSACAFRARQRRT